MTKYETDTLHVWGSHLIEANTIVQADRTGRLPFVEYVALMPDAHVGMGSTVGSVIPTEGAIIPSAIGVDIGCGMTAWDTGLNARHLPDDLSKLHSEIAQRIPAGQPKGRGKRNAGSHDRGRGPLLGVDLIDRMPELVDQTKAISQFGTLGGGNHFIEVLLDEGENVWVVLHSGSRAAGHKIATEHIAKAKGLMMDYFIKLEDPALAYLVEGTREFRAYIADMIWAQDYAADNRREMMIQVKKAMEFLKLPVGGAGQTIDCHHNYTARERHHGRHLWVTRKGAIRARAGDMGIIPGSMADGCFIVEGLGNRESFESAAHGAGRVMSRKRAKAELSVEGLEEAMGDIAWNGNAQGLLDEAPGAYKRLDEVMDAQTDLVQVVHRLRPVLNFKGT